ncbi:MAG: hypothetical protein DBW97_03595 [SAR86 cluster bacterium]|uniref:Nucleoside triphosphate pyrophosphatase n=1 Tax=SAR86 cluster bacterium TaxID=2030880 RepID=A0A368BN60_9GAMM|nr:MAG: hypothetical protein DBW97_03595 [SAR86 cluster bacterium]
MKKIVLASNSEIRRKIASAYCSDIKFTSPQINEELLKDQLGDLAPNELCYELAKAKALSVSDYKDHIILGCDQICLLEDKIYSKPLNSEAACNQLMELSNKTHFLIGSYFFCQNKEVIYKEQVTSEMSMRSLSKQEIEDYIKLDEPYNSCGAYKFEENGYKLFNSVTGTLEAINGLPIEHLLKNLNEHV